MTLRRAPALLLALNVLLAGMAFGCEGDGSVPEYTLDGETPSEIIAAYRERQALRYYTEGAEDVVTTLNPLTTDGQVATAALTLASDECWYRRSSTFAGTSACSPAGATTSCAYTYCDLEQDLCVANVFLEIAEAVDDVVLHGRNGANPPIIRIVPPQSHASRAAMYEAAGRFLDLGNTATLKTKVTNLRAAILKTGWDATCDDPVLPGSSTLIGAAAGQLVREITQRSTEARTAAVQSYVDLADGIRSEELSDTAPGNVEHGAGANTSTALRVHASSLALGLRSTAAVESAWPTAPCRAKLSDSAREALSLLRLAGLDPARVKRIAGTPDATATPLALTAGSGDDSLLGGPIEDPSPSTPTTWKSRIARLWGQEERINEMTLQAFLDELGLTIDDFKQARFYLYEELRAFKRSYGGEPTALMQRIVETPGGQMTMWLATETPPSIPPGQIFSRDLFGTSYWTTYSNDVELVTHGAEPLYRALTSPTAWQTAFIQSLRETRLEHRNSWSHSIVQQKGASGTATNLLLRTLSSPGDVVLTRTIAGLKCATTGEIEGQPCVWSNVGVQTQAATPTARQVITYVTGTDPGTDAPDHWFVENFSPPPAGAPPATPGVPSYNYIVWTNLPSLPNSSYYLLERIPGMPANTPGSYRPIAAGPLFGPTAALTTLRQVSLEAEVRSGQILTPNIDDCSQHALSCGQDNIFDDRIALENELIDDGNGVETSWRTYLELAAQAAEEADLLGEDAFNQQLEVDRQAEGALSELEDLCGATISLARAEEIIASNRGKDPIATLLAHEATVNDPNLQRLASCIGTTTTRPYVTLGDRQLCAWYANGSTSQLCAVNSGTTTDLDCPRAPTVADDAVPPTGTSCEVPPGGAYTPYRIGVAGNEREILGYFTEPANGGTELGGETDDAPCADLRLLRHRYMNGGGTNEDEVRQLVDKVFNESEFFSLNNIQQLARSIRFEAQADNHSAVFVNGSPFIDTGDIAGGPADSTICATNGERRERFHCLEDVGTYTDVGLDADSLFCPTDGELAPGCAEASQRAEFNARLAAAAGIARWLGQSDFTEFVLPSHRAWTGSRDSEKFLEGAGGFDYRQFVVSNRPEEISYCNEAAGRPLWTWNVPYAVDLGGDEPGAMDTVCGLGRIHFRTFQNERMFREDAESKEWMDRHGQVAANFLTRLAATSPRGGEAESTAEWWANPIRQMLNYDTPFGTVTRANATASVSCIPYDRCTYQDAKVPWRMRDSSPDDDPMSVFLPHADRIPAKALFDGLELLCEAASRGQERWGCGYTGSISAEDELAFAAERVECLADQITMFGARTVFTGFPDAATDALREASSTGAFSSVGGQLGEEVSRLRVAMVDIAQVPTQMNDIVRGIARDMRKIELELDRQDVTDQLNKNAMRSAIASAAKACAGGIIGAIFNPKDWASAAVTCAEATVQIGLAVKRQRLQSQITDIDRQTVFLEFEDSMVLKAGQLNAIGMALIQSVENVDASLGRIDTIRRTSQRTFNRILFLNDDATKDVFRSNTAVRARLSTSRERYRRAFRDAVRLAFLARRAIEQRFGVDLMSMDDTMTLVDAPSTWASKVCEVSGIDYRRITDPDGDAGPNYADEYIGDYVRRLERFVQSYSQDYPFQAGVDTAVVSLRDDVHNVRAACHQPAVNLLAYSNDLTREGAIDDVAVWEVFDRAGGVGSTLPNAVYVRPIDAQLDQPIVSVDGLGQGVPINAREGLPRAFRVEFGPTNGSPIEGCPGSAPCGWQPSTTYGQRIILEPGTYRISWYARPTGSSDPSDAVRVRSLTAGVDLAHSTVVDTAASGVWDRYWYLFELTYEQEIAVQIRSSQAQAGTAGAAIDVAGLMLEDVTSMAASVTENDTPGMFVSTLANGESIQNVCEDSDGENFRKLHWRRGCLSLCDTGFGGSCTGTNRIPFCYWETEFSVTNRAIERNAIFRHSGFARGNFNYRIDSLGVNFVGSAARVCADPEVPSTCYSAGYIPYTIEHAGPYVVRNYAGEPYNALLFPGRIEHARGLAAERYLTNPLASNDQALIMQYYRLELQGRPLTGTYRLRVWDEPGVNFDGIEDVQLVLNYRYWTRAN